MCESMYRFTREEILRILPLLEMPPVMRTSERDRFTAEEGFCMLLYRYAFPRRLVDLLMLFGRSQEASSRIVAHVEDLLFARFGGLLRLSAERFTAARVHEYARLVLVKSGNVVPSVWAFIDNTLLQVARPVRDQREYYTRKKMHALNCPGLVTPDGLFYMYTPRYGRRHDSLVFRESGMEDDIRLICGEAQAAVPGSKLWVYGDSGFAETDVVMAPYRRNGITAEQQEFNSMMSELRQSVEWPFARFKSFWAQAGYHRQLKVHPCATAMLLSLKALIGVVCM